jgi:hypothetical protein
MRAGDWFLIMANLLPVYGAWFLNWSVRQIFLVYCLEPVIIGVFTLAKLFIATAIRKEDWWLNSSRTMVHGIFFIIFFLMHYGLFLAIQLTAFLNFTSINNNLNPDAFNLVFHPFSYLDKDAWLMLSVFVFGYGYENLSFFILDNEYRTKPFMRIMFEPYLRIFIQQFIVLLGGFALGFGAGAVFILLFSIIKIFFTVFIDYESILNRASAKSFS